MTIRVGSLRNEGGVVSVTALLTHPSGEETSHEFTLERTGDAFFAREGFYDSSRATIGQADALALRGRVEAFVREHDEEIRIAFARD